MKNPCENCPDKVEDSWGLFCNWGCGKNTAWINYQKGVRDVVEWINGVCGCDKFTATDGRQYNMITLLLETWRAKLRDWGINE